MTFLSTLFTYVAVLAAIAGVGIYFFGIPPEVKRKLERGALKTMGENKASYALKGTSYTAAPPAPPLRPLLAASKRKENPEPILTCNARPDQIEKVPASDQQDVRNLKRNLGNTLGGAVQNPLGEHAGETADGLTSPFTGR